jgi:hypothetical protein
LTPVGPSTGVMPNIVVNISNELAILSQIESKINTLMNG